MSGESQYLTTGRKPSAIVDAILLSAGDNAYLFFGADNDVAIGLNSAGLAANTALTDSAGKTILIGTPVSQALAANSLIISNVTANGDIAMYGNLGGNSQQFLHYDTSASQLSLLMGKLKYTAGSFAFQEATTISSTVSLAFDNPAITNTAASNVARMFINSTNAITLNTGTVPVLASLYLAEPNITVGTGAVTLAATLYVAGQPTEGSTNAGIYTAANVSVSVGGDIVCRASGNIYSTFFVGNSAASYIDTRNAADGDYISIRARDSDTDSLIETARVAGAADPYFSMGGSQQHKFTNAGLIGFHGATPIAQAVLATGVGASVDNVITALQNLGLVKQS